MKKKSILCLDPGERAAILRRPCSGKSLGDWNESEENVLTHGSGDCYAFAPASRSQKTPQVETLFDNGIGICSRRETHRFRIQKLMCRRIAECRIRYSGRKVRLGRFYSSESAGSLVSSEPTKICTRLFCMGKQSAASVAGCRTQVNSEREAKLVT